MSRFEVEVVVVHGLTVVADDAEAAIERAKRAMWQTLGPMPPPQDRDVVISAVVSVGHGVVRQVG